MNDTGKQKLAEAQKIASETLGDPKAGDTDTMRLALAVISLTNELARRERATLTDAQIKHMVDRFLGWRLPENFNPDGGINFKKTFNEHTVHPMKHEPSGTNLFDATQADAMVRYIVDGMPT